jgi:hypothetical protein
MADSASELAAVPVTTRKARNVALEHLAQALLGALRPVVVAVGHGGAGIGRAQGLEDARMDPEDIVAGEVHPLAVHPLAAASIFGSLSENISSIWLSLMMSGGENSSVSPEILTIRPWSWKPDSMTS